MFDFLIAGISAPIFLLVLTGMTVGMVGGFIGVGGGEMGVRLLNYTKALGLSGIALLTGSVGIMIGLFLYTQIETHKAQKKINELTKEGKTVGRELRVSKLPLFFQSIQLWPIIRCHTARLVISMWVVVVVGICTGILAGFFGVGGGFILVPALVYGVGATPHIDVGPDLLEIVVSGGYGG